MIHVHVHVHVHVHAHAMSYVNGISSRSASNLVRPPAPHRRLTTSASIAIRRSSTPASQPSVHPSVISPPPVRSHQIRSAKSAVASSAPAPASPLVDSCSPPTRSSITSFITSSVHHHPSVHRYLPSAVHRPVHRSIYQSIHRPSIVLGALVACFSAPHALGPRDHQVLCLDPPEAWRAGRLREGGACSRFSLIARVYPSRDG